MRKTETPPAPPPVLHAPICAQCKLPMTLQRLQPGESETTLLAVFRCEECHLAEEVKLF